MARPASADPQKPTSLRRKRRSTEEIMARLIDAARHEFERCGYAGATTAAIARRAQVSEAQLFRYFPSKAELFRETIFKPLDAEFTAFNEWHLSQNSSAGDVRAQTRGYIAELQDFIAEHAPKLMALAVAHSYEKGTTEDVAAMGALSRYFDMGAARMAERMSGDPVVPPELMVRVSFAAVLASVMFKDWLFPDALADEAAVRRAIAEFVLDGVSANRPRQTATE